MKQALTIAGSDPGGGAGIQADIKTMSAHGVYAVSVVTAITAQNTVDVRGAEALSGAMVRKQLEAVFDDFDIAAVKTGMLFTSPVIEAVAQSLASKTLPLVIDPVLASHAGRELLQEGAVRTLVETLFPLARLVTPNLHEAAFFAGVRINSLEDVRRAAEIIHEMGPRAVVVKGGHATFSPGTDVLLDEGRFYVFEADQAYAQEVHGTGCTFSAAVTARLALGDPVPAAVEKAKAYTAGVISHALEIGRGQRTGNHFYFIKPVDFPDG